MWGCDCAQEARESQTRPCGQRRGENSSERGVAKSRNNCRDEETRSARLGRAYPGCTISRAGSAGIKGISKGTGGEGSAERKSEELNPSGCKQIGQDCKAPNVGSGVGGRYGKPGLACML